VRLGRLGGETLCEQQLSSTNGRRAGGQVTFPAASLPPPCACKDRTIILVLRPCLRGALHTEISAAG